MLRLDIEYDFLPRESEILHLHFWDCAFEQLKAKGVLYFETEGKNKGCWVMTRGLAAWAVFLARTATIWTSPSRPMALTKTPR